MRLVLTHHPRFRRAALEEAAEALDEVTEVERPDHSVTILETPAPDVGALGRTVFIQHVAPADLVIPIAGSAQDVDRIKDATSPLTTLIHSPFAVQCRRGAHSGGTSHAEAPYSTRDVEIAIGTPVERAGGAIDLEEPTQVLSVYLGRSQAYAGLSGSADNLRVLIPQHRRHTATPVICRAEHKLEEAIDLWRLGPDLDGTRALDIGASPGGWSWVLARSGARVTAVDPGELDPRVAGHDLISHMRGRAESLDFEGPQFDWVVNDMNVDPPLAAEVLLRIRPWLTDGARSVCTLKLAGRSRPRGVLAEFVRRLQPGYELEAARHLYSNRQEVTLLLRRT